MYGYNYKECHPFLDTLSREDIERFLSRSETRRYKKGQHIVSVMDDDTNLYLIDSGAVRATLFSADGKEVSFVDIDTGGNFGEFSAIDGRPRSANVIALSDVKITVVPPKVFLETLEKYPAACMDMLRQLSAIIRGLCDRVFEYSTLDVPNRVHLELLRLGRENMDLDGIARISNPPTQIEMASRLSCTREAVSREYKNLENLGIISRSRKKLIIDDYQRLQEMVGFAST
jgi:CRP-like cAMP-binding protein